MLFGRYGFECKFTSQAELPLYKGSTFRGVFGRALKHVVCVGRRADDCSTCLLKNQCLYVLVFETGLKTDLPENNRMATPPHPFVIEPPDENKSRYQSGDRFDFSLLLFGNVNHRLAYFIYAFEQMGKIGIGKKIDGRRATFNLGRVRAGDRIIYDAKNGTLQELPTPRLTLTPVGAPQVETIRINLLTPLRFKYQNQFNPDLPFHVLVRALLRRASSLLAAYDGGDPELDYKGLVYRAQHVEIAESNLKWADWRRYSFRQKQEMKLGGLLGSITYRGDLGEYLPLIRFGQEAHIGKQTAFGLGNFDSVLTVIDN